MTNAEKYEQVFGFPPNSVLECPTSDCKKCPLFNLHRKEDLCASNEELFNWWNSEYRESKRK